MIRSARSGTIVALLAAVAACVHPSRAAYADSAPHVHELHAEPLRFATPAGERQIRVEIADDAAERAKGLMFREELAEDLGLLFVFEYAGRQSFWMKNTPLPLDLVFIAENGRVVAIRQGEPFSEIPISPEPPARFVLELGQGTAKKLGLRIGTRLLHPVIDEIHAVQ